MQQAQLLDADDLFSDLIGSSVLKSSTKQAPQQQQQHGSSGPNSGTQPARISSSGHAGAKEPVLPEPDLLDAALNKPDSNGANAGSAHQQQQGNSFTLSSCPAGGPSGPGWQVCGRTWSGAWPPLGQVASARSISPFTGICSPSGLAGLSGQHLADTLA